MGLGVWAGLKAKSKIRNQRPSRLVGSYCRGGSAGEARLRKERVDSRDALHAFKERLDTANEKMESIAESMNSLETIAEHLGEIHENFASLIEIEERQTAFTV